MKKTTHTRRDFMKAALAVGSLATATPFHILKAAPTAPSERITLGFIGLGRMGRSHIVNQFAKFADVQIVAVSDVDQTRRDYMIKTLNQSHADFPGISGPDSVTAYNDYRDLLARNDVDAVVIATPDHWHAIQTIDALRAGKDVYCQKPLTHTPVEALRVMEEVKKNGRILQTGSQQRTFWPEFRIGCELVINGVIGPVKEVKVSFGGPPRAFDLPAEEIEPGLDWNRWIGPAPMCHYNSELSPRGVRDVSPRWRHFWEFGGGSVMDFGAHHVDIARWGMQLDEDMPTDIRLTQGTGKGIGAQLVFANGVTITHENDIGGSIVFQGETDSIRLGRDRFELWRGNDKRNREFYSRHQAVKAEERYLTGPNVRHLYKSDDHPGDFLNAVRSRKRPICHEDIGGRTAICCHLMNIAYRYDQPLKWDGQKNTFAPGSGDPAWLTRDYREGFELPR